MNRFLQINLHCAKAAHDLMGQYATEGAIDYIFLSEYNNPGNQHWYHDSNGKAAIVCNPNITITDIGQSESGFRWIEVDGMTLYSCCWSPNTSLQEYKQFLIRLERDVRSRTTGIPISGDFNAWHTTWRSRFINARGEALVDMISSLGLIICNKGNSPTFQRGNSESIVDLTLALHGLSTRMTNWMVTDDTSLSDHNYITYTIKATTNSTYTNTPKWNTRKVNRRELETILKSKVHDIDTENPPADECAKFLTTLIQDTCKSIMPTLQANSRRKSVYWWTPEINTLRKTPNHLRRVY